MLVKIPTSIANEVAESTKNEWLKGEILNSNLQRYVILDGIRTPPVVLKALYKATKDSNAGYAQNIAFLYEASKSTDNIRVRNMKEVRAAIIKYLRKDFIKGYLFSLGDNKAIVPYVVTKVSAEEGSWETSMYANRARDVSVEMAYTTYKGALSNTAFSIRPYQMIELARKLDLSVKEVLGKPRNRNEEEASIVDFHCAEGIPIDEVFKAAGFFKENATYHEMAKKQTDRYLKFLPMFGKQFQVRGFSESTVSHRYFWSSASEGDLMLTEGKPGRCIMDTIPQVCFSSEEEKGGGRPTSRRRGYSSRYYDDDEGDSMELSGYESNDAFSSIEELEIPLDQVTLEDIENQVLQEWNESTQAVAPLHPTLSIFHLEKHRFYRVHVNNLRPYEYKENISRYLILPKEVKTLTQMLVGGAKGSFENEDIIEGKSQSTVIACIGAPGVGKTLTAEVLAEASKKPLYKIPADQLGGTAGALEKKLRLVLRRAERWDAVLMIDEANAYIHARGTDISQNAIVGVFLRLIEYFKGTLIFTTNQTAKSAKSKQLTADTGFDIDDAILNRCDAVIPMGLPTKEDAKEIWKVQRELLKVEDLTDSMIDKLVARYEMSGRSIRKLLLNAARWAAHHNEKLSLEHFKVSAKFIPFSDVKEVNE